MRPSPASKSSSTGATPDAEYTTTTDAAGRFAFSGLPRGDYRIGFAAPEWSFVWKSYAVDGEDDPDLVFRGARPIVSQLTASAALDRSAYGVGDTAIVTLTLTNSDAVPIPDLTAVAYSNSAAIDLGELAQGGPGVTIPANAGRTLRISVAVDRHAADSGYSYVTCTFGAPPHSNGSVTATAEARIPGAVAAKVTGLVAQQLPVPGVTTMGPPAFGPRVPDLKVYLRDQFTGEIIVRATTGAAGEFEFRDVPAGAHQLGLVGPWRIVYGGPRFYVGVHEGGLGPMGHLVLVAPGPDQPDPDPAPQPGARPHPHRSLRTPGRGSSSSPRRARTWSGSRWAGSSRCSPVSRWSCAPDIGRPDRVTRAEHRTGRPVLGRVVRPTAGRASRRVGSPGSSGTVATTYDSGSRAPSG